MMAAGMPPGKRSRDFFTLQPEPYNSSKPVIAGLLLIIVAILGIITCLMAIFLSSIVIGGTPFQSETGSVEGKVTFSDTFEPATGVNVTIQPMNETIKTDLNGEFKFRSVKTGTYTIAVNESGYKNITQKISFFDPNGETYLEYELEKGSGEIEKEPYESSLAWASNIFKTCGIIIFVFSVIAIFGAVNAIKRTNYWLSIIGATLGIFTFGIFIGSIMSFVALLLLLLSKKSFDN